MVKKRESESTSVTVKLGKVLYAKLVAIAAATDIPPSEAVRDLVKAAVVPAAVPKPTQAEFGS